MFTTDVGALSTYTSLWAYDDFAQREERRATLQANDDWKVFLGEDPAADPHAAEPDPRSYVLLSTALTMGSLDGKVAVVTGAAQGIGRAIAEGLADNGARIVIADLQGAEAAAEAFADGVGITADVGNERDVQRLADVAVERCGTIDILVNNAGVYASLEMRPFERDPARRVAPGDGRERRIDVPDVPRGRAGDARERPRQARQHLFGHTVSGRPAPAALRDVEGRDRRAHARTREGARQGQRALLNCVAPGFTMSAGVEAHPEVVEKLRDVSVAARTIQRDQTPDDVVGAVVYLSGPGSAFVTGQTIVIDGGQTFH